MDQRILLAEDDPTLRELLGLDLAECGFEVELAHDGEEAVRAIERQAPALLLLDLLMPRLDGFAVLEHVRRRGHDFPVIVLSNLSEGDQWERCRAMGAREFLVKSDLGSGEICRVVERCLR